MSLWRRAICNDWDRSVAHAAAEEARSLAVGADPGAAARDLDGCQDPGEGRVGVKINGRSLSGVADFAIELIGDAQNVRRVMAVFYCLYQLRKRLLSLAYHHEVEVLQDLLRHCGGMRAAGDENGLHLGSPGI